MRFIQTIRVMSAPDRKLQKLSYLVHACDVFMKLLRVGQLHLCLLPPRSDGYALANDRVSIIISDKKVGPCEVVDIEVTSKAFKVSMEMGSDKRSVFDSFEDFNGTLRLIVSVMSRIKHVEVVNYIEQWEETGGAMAKQFNIK